MLSKILYVIIAAVIAVFLIFLLSFFENKAGLIYIRKVYTNGSAIIIHLELYNNNNKTIELIVNRSYFLPGSSCPSKYPFSIVLYKNYTPLDIYDINQSLFCFAVPSKYYLLPHSSNLSAYDYNFDVSNLSKTIVINKYNLNGTILSLPNGKYIVSILEYNRTFNYTVLL